MGLVLLVEPTTTTVPPLTVADVSAVLQAPVSAWVESRGGAAEAEAVRAAARGLLRCADPNARYGFECRSQVQEELGAMPATSAYSMFGVLDQLAFTGVSWPLVKGLADAGIVAVPPFFPDGTYTVGETIPPGTYETGSVDGCYWARLDSAGEIIDNNFVTGAPRVEVTIRASDYGFTSERCGIWFPVG